MRLMVVSPHPDDETLGAGGTILKFQKMGYSVCWLNITDMKTEDGWEESIIIHRQKQIEKIREFYNFERAYNLRYSPTKLLSIDSGEMIHKIKMIFDEVKPEWLIIPGQYDAHSDHRVVYNCCMAAAKGFRAPYIKRITTMEIPSETDYGFQMEKFEPNLYVDITDMIDAKIEAMMIYDTEIESVPFPRSLENIKALARYRGGSCMSQYAEAFQIVKQLE